MINNKKILAIVPARGGSKGIRLKNLIEINGKSLVKIVGELIIKLDFIDRSIVSTDHEQIAKEALDSGLDAPFMRPKDLSGDFIADIPVLTHALLEVEKIDNILYDIIIMLQPTSPMRKKTHIYDSIIKLLEGNYDSIITVSETDSKAHPHKQLIIEDGCVKNFDENKVNLKKIKLNLRKSIHD